jgi:hypothetical protein
MGNNAKSSQSKPIDANRLEFVEGSSAVSSGLLADEDAFDLSSLRLSQDFADDIGVKKVVTTIPVRKPDRQSFVRVHPDSSYRIQTALLELREDREVYLVERGLWSELAAEIVPKTLYFAITRQGTPFIWSVRMPTEDGRLDQWNRSAHEAARIAMSRWVRVVSNMPAGAYDVFEAGATFADPTWPDLSFQDVLRIAFKDRFIRTIDDPIVRRLQGGL